jgi:hypothetical protein
MPVSIIFAMKEGRPNAAITPSLQQSRSNAYLAGKMG